MIDRRGMDHVAHRHAAVEELDMGLLDAAADSSWRGQHLVAPRDHSRDADGGAIGVVSARSSASSKAGRSGA